MGRDEKNPPPPKSKGPPPSKQAPMGKGKVNRKEYFQERDDEATEENVYASPAEEEEIQEFTKKGGPKAPAKKKVQDKQSLPQIEQKTKVFMSKSGKEKFATNEDDDDFPTKNSLPSIQMEQKKVQTRTPIEIKEFVMRDHLDPKTNEFTTDLVCVNKFQAIP
jgi:arsenate reductase-like glutaredoxin family protein